MVFVRFLGIKTLFQLILILLMDLPLNFTQFLSFHWKLEIFHIFLSLSILSNLLLQLIEVALRHFQLFWASWYFCWKFHALSLEDIFSVSVHLIWYPPIQMPYFQLMLLFSSFHGFYRLLNIGLVRGSYFTLHSLLEFGLQLSNLNPVFNEFSCFLLLCILIIHEAYRLRSPHLIIIQVMLNIGCFCHLFWFQLIEYLSISWFPDSSLHPSISFLTSLLPKILKGYCLPLKSYCLLSRPLPALLVLRLFLIDFLA